MPRVFAWVIAAAAIFLSTSARAEFDLTVTGGAMVTFGSDPGAVIGSAGSVAVTLGGHWSSYVLGTRLELDTDMPSLNGIDRPTTSWYLYFRREFGDRHSLYWFCGGGLGVAMAGFGNDSPSELGPAAIVEGGFALPIGAGLRLVAGADVSALSFNVTVGLDSVNVGAFVGVAY